MLEKAPLRMAELVEANQLTLYIQKESDRLEDRGLSMAADWRRCNRIPSSAPYFERVSWHRQSSLYARELIERELLDRFYD